MRKELPRVTVLGPVRLPGRAGELVAPRSRRAAELVVALALAGGRPVPGASLIRELWPEDIPRDPRAALQNLVSRLRADTAEGLIVSRAGGYALTGDSDLAFASRCLDRARDLLRAGDGAAAADVAREGLASWTGEVDPQLDADAAITRSLVLRRERLAGDLTRLVRDGAAAAGDHQTVVDLTARALRADATDEDAALAMMSALAALGRPGEGVRVFSRLRHALSLELGTDPGPDLVRLNAQLLAARAGSGPGPGGGSGSGPGGGSGSGPGAGLGPGPGSGSATPVSPEAGRTVLGVRAAPGPLVGRDDDVAAVERELSRSRLVTVLGTGGLGKTRLAQEVAARSRAPFVAVVELAGVRTDDDVVVALADGLGIAVTGTGRLADRVQAAASTSQVLDHVRHREGLLVLDNCEHVIGGAAQWVADILAAAPRLRVLATSRTPLLVGGEQAYPLGPLATEAGRGPAVRLFEERARAVRPSVDLPAHVVARLCERLDGLPLAIELAAARTRTMSVEEIEAHLDERFALLRAADRLAPDRHRTLEAVIEWSWNLLGPLERQVLARLAVLPDGLSPDAAVAIGSLGAGASRRWQILDAVDGLVMQSLLSVSERDGVVRYRMLETVREFGALRLESAGESEQALGAVLAWARDFVVERRAAIFGPGQVQAMGDVRREQENLLFALRESVRAGRPDVAVHVFGALAGVWAVLGAEEKISGLVDTVAGMFAGWRVPSQSVDAAVFALTVVAVISAFTLSGVGVRALARLRRLLRRDDVGPRARALAAVTLVRSPREMDDHCARLRASDDHYLAMLGYVLTAQNAENAGRLDEALNWAHVAYERATREGYAAERALTSMFLTSCASELGDSDAVLHWAGPAREGLQRIGAEDSLHQLDWLELCAAVTTGDLERAETLCARLDALGDGGLGERDMRSAALASRAEIALARGDEAAALAQYASAVASFDVREPAGFVAPLGAVSDEGFVSPWYLIVTAAFLVRLVLAGDRGRAAEVGAELRTRVLAGLGERPGFVDHPVIGTTVLALGIHRALDTDDVAGGAWLIAAARRMGSRQDLGSLRHDVVTGALIERRGPAPLREARALVDSLSGEELIEQLFARLAG